MSPFSALVSYLKENAALSNAKIAELLNRSQSQVATVVTLRLEITDLSYSVPLHVFSDKNYSILEHTVHNLMNNHGLNLKQVSYLLNRSSSFIWKVHKRYEAKSE
jgi:predicted DNA-binding ArsR family transcriptional regulator